MSNGIKTKGKNKNKNVNKVKIFLANPSKPKCPSLDDESLQQLKVLLTDAITESNQAPRAFATSAHICLGLESSLRAINNLKASCVLLSTNIKPCYLLGLIARNAEVKDETVPTFAQPNLEELSQTVFGVRSLAIVLPSDTSKLGDDLTKWIESHRKPKRIKKVQVDIQKKPKLKKKIVKTHQVPCEELKTLAVKDKTVVEPAPTKPWGSSFISLSNSSVNMDIANSEEDEKILENVLGQMAKKVKHQTEKEDEMVTTSDGNKHNDNCPKEALRTDEDEFLTKYSPLIVHKIRPNPDRKPRKMRKKSENKHKNIK